MKQKNTLKLNKINNKDKFINKKKKLINKKKKSEYNRIYQL